MKWNSIFSGYVTWMNNRIDRKHLGRPRRDLRAERLANNPLDYYRKEFISAIFTASGDTEFAQRLFNELSNEPNGPDLSPFPVMPDDDLLTTYRWDSATVGDRLEEYLSGAEPSSKVRWKDVFAVEECIITPLDFATSFAKMRSRLRDMETRVR